MRILVITQYFWPENFRINDLCLELKARGHEVVVLTGKPNYPKGKYFEGYSYFDKHVEFWNGIKIYRANLILRGNGGGLKLFLNYISFALLGSLKVFSIKESIDKIIVYQLSPATVGFPGLVAKKKFKKPLLFYIQDLWPESLTDGGGIKSKIILKNINRLMNLFYKNSELILIQSKGFKDFLINKGVIENKIKYLPNTVEQFYKPESVLNSYKEKFPQGFNILFAGNIGLAQDFDTIIKAAQLLDQKGLIVNWVILGDGRGKKSAMDMILNLSLSHRFHFLGTFPSTEMPFYFACADVLLVSLKKSVIFSLTIPSKIQSYLACKKPIIGNLDGEGALAILAAKAGLCSASGNFHSLANNVEVLYKMTSMERNEFAVNGYHYYLTEFERNKVYDKLESYLLN